MSTIKKRIYNSASRAAQSRQTQSRILTAAKKLFESKGFEQVTIDEISHKAKVSAPSIYAIFQSKKGVLLALMDNVLAAEQYNLLLESVEEAKSEKSPRKLLETAARISRQLYDAEKTELNLLRDALILNPEFKVLENERERRRYERQEETIELMAKQKMFVKHLSISKVRDILWAFTGRDLYRMLVHERRWSSDEYEQWLADLLIQTLLE
jgi:AcrR family transcriptional regulator